MDITNLLFALCSPDSNIRKSAEASYAQMKAEDAVKLSEMLISGLSSEPAHVQFASVLLRQLVSQLPQLADAVPNLLSTVIGAFSSTSDAFTQRRLAHLLAQIAASSKSTDGVNMILNGIAAGVQGVEETSLFLLEKLAEYSPNRVWSSKDSITGLLVASLTTASGMNSPSSTSALSQLITTTSAVAESTSFSQPPSPADTAALGSATLPLLLSVLSNLLSQPDGGEASIKPLEALSEAVLQATPYFSYSTESLSSTINACLQIAQAASLPMKTRLNSLHLLANLLNKERKSINKDPTLMSSMCSFTGPAALCLSFIYSETDEDFESWAEEPPQFYDDNVWDRDDDACAAESYLEAFVHDLGGKSIFPTLLPGIEHMLGEDWRSKRAGLAALERLLEASPVAFSQFSSTAVAAATASSKDANVRVQFQALQLLGSLCNKHSTYKLQQGFTGEMISIICGLMGSSCIKVSNHACNALISFLRGDGSTNENCVEGDLIVPYLNSLLEGLGKGPLAYAGVINQDVVVVVVSGINALACVADVVGKSFEPYYANFMPGLLAFMKIGLSAQGMPINAGEDSSMAILRGSAIEATSILGQAVGGKESPAFLQDATQIMQFVLTYLSCANQIATLQAAADAKLSEANVSLPLPMDKVQASCARISGMMQEDFAQFMPAILPHLLRQAKAKNDMSISEGDEAGLDATNKGEVERDAEMGTESMTVKIPGMGIKKITVNTTVVQEKSQAARAIYEHAYALGGLFAPFSKLCAAALIPLVSFQYNAEVRSTSAMALAPIFDAACAYGLKSYVGGKPVTEQQKALPQQLFGTICNTIVKQLSEERTDPETMVSLADALSEVTGSAYLGLIENVPGKHVAKLNDSEGRQLVVNLTTLVGECLERRKKLFEGLALAGDEDEVAEYEEALGAESDLLTPLVDSIGYTLKSGGERFAPIFDTTIAPSFGKMLVGAGVDVRARFASICLFDDCVEHCGKESANKHAPLLLQGVLEGVDDSKNHGDVELKQACVYGIAQITRQAPHVLATHAKGVLGCLANIVQVGAANEDEVSLVENAVSALASMVVFKKAPFAKALGDAELAGVKEFVLNNFPLREDETEAHLCHENLADMVEIGEYCVVGDEERVVRTMKIMTGVLMAVEEGDSLAAPSTCARFAGLMHKLQSNTFAANAFGKLRDDEKIMVQKAVEAGAREGVVITP